MKRREMLATSSSLLSFVLGWLALPTGKSKASEASGESKIEPWQDGSAE